MAAITLNKARKLLWGTYGKNAVENQALYGTPLPECDARPLGELDDDHLVAILKTQEQIPALYVDAILLILRGRHQINWAIKQEENEEKQDRLKIRRRDAVEATKAKQS